MVWNLLDTLFHGDITSTLCLSLAVLILLAGVSWMTKLIRWFRFFQNLPGEPSYSILYGNVHKYSKNPEQRIALERGYVENVNSKFFRFWISSFKPIIFVYHPETIKTILKSSAPKSRGFGRVYEYVVPWIGEGLIVSNGPLWYRSRRLITPAFHFDILKPYVAFYNVAADKLTKKLDVFARSGEAFNMCPMIVLCTLEIILKCAMSYDVDIQESGHHPYERATREISELFCERTRNPYHWIEWIYKRTSKGRTFFKHCDYVHAEAERIIRQRKTQLKSGNKPKGRLDFIDLLLMARDEDGQPMTTTQIRNEVDTFMFAGHDTTSSALVWLLYCLAKHRDYQLKVQEEIDTVLEGRDSEIILWSDLSEIPTLSLCIKESMRLFSPVPYVQREHTEPIVLDGHTIPAGISITLSFIHLHRNKAVWDEPDEFKPERFLPEQSKGRDSFSYVPFSAGSRNCIGQHFALDEIKVVTARILARYNVKLAEGHEEPKRFPKTTLETQNGLWLQLEPRIQGNH